MEFIREEEPPLLSSLLSLSFLARALLESTRYVSAREGASLGIEKFRSRAAAIDPSNLLLFNSLSFSKFPVRKLEVVF